MPRYKFKWTNFDDRLLRGLCRDLDLEVTEPAESLRSYYGARPTDDFVREAWPALLERWLAKDRLSRRVVVDALWASGLREGEPPERAADEMSYLRRRNNAKRLRDIVLDVFIALGEAAKAEEAAIIPSPPVVPETSGDARPRPVSEQSPTKPRGQGKVEGFADKVGFIWSVADLLRGDYKAHEYGQVILPLTVLRRLDCVLEPTKDAVVARAKGLVGKIDNIDPILLRAAGQPFYNISPLNFTRLLDDAPNIAANLRTYIAGYSTGAVEVLEKYGFDNQITRLDNAGLLYHVIARFADVELHPDLVSNEAMGYIFEELLRKFSEMSNESAGEHFTPREVIRLMVNILFSEDDDVLRGTAPVRSMYDPACGTGGMLTGGQEHLAHLNPRARLEVFGQELNAETWAIARSDLMIKGQDPARIVLGNSFTDDGFTGQHFDYMLANPPFGVEWKRIERQIKDEAEHLGDRGRFGAGLPRISDGSFLFLQHMISKMKTVSEGGSRLAIVFSGSPLFSGGAGSGESEIRRWIIENDWLEGVVALPDQLFYNTGISTYFWIVTNRKTDDRKGKIALLDSREQWAKMRKGLGEKRKEITDDQIGEITRLYHDAVHVEGGDDRVKVFANSEFGYRRITVERSMRRRWYVTDEALSTIMVTKPFMALAKPSKGAADQLAAIHEGERFQQRLVEVLNGLRGVPEDLESAFDKRLGHALGQVGLTIPAPLRKAILAATAQPDVDAPVVYNRKGQPVPAPDLRDNENVPLSEDIESYMAREVLFHVPDAWVDESKTKIGYEIPFTRHFYHYVPPRLVAEIDAEIDAVEAEIRKVLREVAR